MAKKGEKKKGKGQKKGKSKRKQETRKRQKLENRERKKQQTKREQEKRKQRKRKQQRQQKQQRQKQQRQKRKRQRQKPHDLHARLADVPEGVDATSSNPTDWPVDHPMRAFLEERAEINALSVDELARLCVTALLARASYGEVNQLMLAYDLIHKVQSHDGEKMYSTLFRLAQWVGYMVIIRADAEGIGPLTYWQTIAQGMAAEEAVREGDD
jgi:hypothetical protein